MKNVYSGNIITPRFEDVATIKKKQKEIGFFIGKKAN